MKVKRTGLLTKVIILVMILYAIWALVSLGGRVREAEARKAELTQVVADIKDGNAAMKDAIEHSTDDRVMESIARGEGYIYQDEEVYYAE